MTLHSDVLTWEPDWAAVGGLEGADVAFVVTFIALKEKQFSQCFHSFSAVLNTSLKIYCRWQFGSIPFYTMLLPITLPLCFAHSCSDVGCPYSCTKERGTMKCFPKALLTRGCEIFSRMATATKCKKNKKKTKNINKDLNYNHYNHCVGLV